MPGTLTTYNNVDATAAGGLYFLPPVPAGLTGWFDLGGTEAGSIKNRARGGAGGGVKIGAPTFNPAFAALKTGSDYIQTGTPESASFTILAVCKSADTLAATANRPRILGNLNAFANGGVNLFVSASTGAPQATISAQIAYTNAGTPTLLARGMAIANFSTWRVIALTFDAVSGVVVINDLGAPAPSTISWPGGSTRLISANAFRLGSGFTGTEAGLVDMTLAAFWSRVLSGAELGIMYAFIQSLLLGRKGLTV